MNGIAPSRNIFITGGTGYIGSRLIPILLQRGHRVRALVRASSANKLPKGSEPVFGDALNADTFHGSIHPADTFLQLVGVAHPGPSKAKQFREVDLVSVRASVGAAKAGRVPHFIYLSVAQPASVMKDYIAVRAEGEALIRESGLNATLVRPWYVLGPGHRWPLCLLPFYWLLKKIPSTRDSAHRLDLVTIEQMLAVLIHAVENPPAGVRIVEVPEIRRFQNVA